jgi:hypothetical protein
MGSSVAPQNLQVAGSTFAESISMRVHPVPGRFSVAASGFQARVDASLAFISPLPSFLPNPGSRRAVPVGAELSTRSAGWRRIIYCTIRSDSETPLITGGALVGGFLHLTLFPVTRRMVLVITLIFTSPITPST